MTAAAVLIMVIASGSAAISLRPDRDEHPPPKLDPDAAATPAERACQLMIELEDAIGRNAPAEDVFTLADDAVRAGREAQRLDPLWTPLAGGVQAVSRGLRDDDPALTADGIAVVRFHCSQPRE